MNASGILLRTTLLATLAAAAPTATAAEEPVFHRDGPNAALQLPFSDAVQVGNLLLLSGQVGNLPGTTRLVPGGIEGESRQAMENIRAILERAGSSLDRVAKCTVFLADMADWPAFNAVYREYFAADRLPARSALGASGLALGARVEVECIAVAAAG